MKKQNKKITRKKTNHRTQKRYPKIVHFARYIPAIIISIFATYIWAHPYVSAALSVNGNDVLAYATNISPAGLLSATNSHRTSNGVAALSANSLLASAAQAKANDMVAKNYWSHVSPNGTQPWAFITAAGYNYAAAGENLAYGFMTSADTVNGWMNSPSHRANMLNNTFTEVGFGIANSENFIGTGKQTVVVAMYGKPQATTPPATTKPKETTKPTTKPATTQETKKTAPQTSKPAEKPKEDQQQEQPKDKPLEAPVENSNKEPIAVADTDQTPPSMAAPTRVSRVQLLTGGSAIWSATFVVLATLSVGLLWLIHKGVHVGRWIRAGEHFLAQHHIHLDLTVLSIIYLGFVLLSTSGTIR